MLLLLVAISVSGADTDGAFVRFRMLEPQTPYYIKVGGFIHVPNWYLPERAIPADAEKRKEARVQASEFTEWFDLKTYAGKGLHKRLNRAGGIAEFPNITARFLSEPKASSREVDIELATAPDEVHVVKRWHEKFEGDQTSVLVSPNLAADASQLELASEMTERRLRWAQEATGGERHSPKQLILQTSFWGPQRAELNVKEAKIVSLLGFNVVGGARDEIREQFPEFREPMQSHDVPLGPNTDRDDIRAAWQKLGKRVQQLKAGVPYGFQDEVCCRPPIGKNEKALKDFHDWLKTAMVSAGDLGVRTLDEAVPIETADLLREQMKNGEAAARRLFYYTARFRQHAATERLLWNTEEFHRQAGAGPVTSTLVADHPYFGGSGLGMGMDQQNSTWGGWPLAMDWFDIGRRRAVDLIGIEDWMGLQFMYGPAYTWEGFQLLGFQAAIFRSASRGEMPIITWITPSDERNLRLKFASALAQGAKHLFYWTYGPTATSTENYWSDQPGSYPGMARVSRLMEFGEPVIAPGKPRRTKVALLYSLSSDLWQPFGYIHMLERRGLYLALVHDHWLVDMLTEEDLGAGRLSDYRVLYSADPCISAGAAKAIQKWVQNGGTFVATCASGSRNEFGEPSPQLAGVFGIHPQFSIEKQPGEYRTRARVNAIPRLDSIKTAEAVMDVIGIKAAVQPAKARVAATFANDGSPAVLENRLGKGRAIWFATTPAISYIKNAHFVADALAEKWPIAERTLLTRYAAQAGAAPLVKLSDPVVEAGVYDTLDASALVLANFTYEPIKTLTVEVPMRKTAIAVKSLEHGPLKFTSMRAQGPWRDEGYASVVRFTEPLGLDDLVLIDIRGENP